MNSNNQTFECICQSLFYGQYCENTIQTCDDENSQCLNGGLCIQANLTHTECKCLPGFIGLYCENDINECLTENKCPANSLCKNTIGSYICKYFNFESNFMLIFNI